MAGDNASTGLDLDAIRDHLVKWDACHVVEQMRNGDGYADLFAEDVGALLAEVERLREIESLARPASVCHRRTSRERQDFGPCRECGACRLRALLDDRTEAPPTR